MDKTVVALNWKTRDKDKWKKILEAVKKFVDWYYAHRDELMSRVDNRVRLADISMATTLVKEWNASASGRALPLTYVYPGNEKWFRFVQWCKTNRNVVIPDYRKAG